MLTSKLFAGDDLLEAIAADRDRISRTRHPREPSVKSIQQALVDWDAGCLPGHGPDGVYGRETAAAVKRFKIEELGVPAASVIDDVGPQTVLKLDALQTALDSKKKGSDTDVTEPPVVEPDPVAVIDEWLNPALDGWKSDVATSAVRVHTSGDSALAAFGAALDGCTSDRALVVIAGWSFDATTPLRAGVTIGQALEAAAGRGARVRALFAGFPEVRVDTQIIRPIGGDNGPAVAFVQRLPNGAAIHDRWVLHHILPGLLPSLLGPVQLGMHHQKAWAIFDGTRLTAWCGGIDFDPNRSSLSDPAHLHDVQAEVEGPAAAALYELLRQRWNNHPEVPAGVTLPALPPEAPRAAVLAAPQRARVVTTFGDPRQFAGLGLTPFGHVPPYPFAPAGSKSLRQLVYHGIAKAQRFIYLEDQYLVDEDVAAKLAEALPRLTALIIVVCDTEQVNDELYQGWERRQRFLAHLEPHKDKVAVVVGQRYIHAKVWVFDDVMATVSSANVNRRGFRHDSEAGVAFGDLGAPGQVKPMRINLWNAHLGAGSPDPTAPPEASLSLWKTPPAGARVTPYPSPPGADTTPVDPQLAGHMNKDQFWDVVDPDCP